MESVILVRCLRNNNNKAILGIFLIISGKLYPLPYNSSIFKLVLKFSKNH